MALFPSLLESRRINESVSNPVIELFETARIYLPKRQGLPQNSGRWGSPPAATSRIEGVVEALLDALHIADRLTIEPCHLPMLDTDRNAKSNWATKRARVPGRGDSHKD